MSNDDLEAMILAGKTPTLEDIRKADPERRKQNAKAKGVLYIGHDLDGDTMEGITSAIHVYQRPGETDGFVRSLAVRERKMHGPGVLVFQHHHIFGEKCSDACRAKVDE